MKHLLLALALGSCSIAYGQPRLEPLQEKDINYGCGCSFHALNVVPDVKNMLLMWEIMSQAKMRINGQLETFEVSEPKSFRKAESIERVGDRTVYKLKSSKWSATVDCRATAVCAQDNESCESTSYVGTLFIASAKGRKAFKVQGTCGC